MSNSIIKYISSLLILFIIFFIYCHISRLKNINNELKILQVSDPDDDIAYELFNSHQPIVFQKELRFWKEFNKLLGKTLTEINTDIMTNKNIEYSNYIKNNLELYNLPLSYDWNIDIRNVILNETSAIFFIKQNNYLQVFGCITGEMRIIITPPDQTKSLSPFTNMVSTIDATSILDKDPIELNYIEIIVRQGNMIYIPYNWLYFIYKNNGNSNNECVIVDCINQSVLNFL
jgi:hypothetical protein